MALGVPFQNQLFVDNTITESGYVDQNNTDISEKTRVQNSICYIFVGSV